MAIKKVAGKFNTADLGTKHLAAREMWAILDALNFESREDVSHLAKQAALRSLEVDDFVFEHAGEADDGCWLAGHSGFDSMD